MRITYLGTAAAEGVPGIFCNCEYCNEARKLGGENIRTRSQTLINDDLLIDFPADTYSHFLNNNIRGDRIKYLFITHSHADHFYEADFNMRIKGCFAHNMENEQLKMYCSRGAFEKMNSLELKDRISIDVNLIKPFETVKTDKYTVTALPARHAPGDDAVIYIIQGDKTILYAHDTGYFYDEVFEFIKNKKYKFDLISMDCTNIELPIPLEGHHMSINNVNKATERLMEIGAVTDDTKKIINHFSHNAAPIHNKLEKIANQIGFEVSFDGFCVKI